MKSLRRKKTAVGARRPAAGPQFKTPNRSRPPQSVADARRLRHELEIRQNEERYQALFERSLDCVYLHDFQGNFLDANQATLDLLGSRRRDIPRLNFASLISADQLPLAFKLTKEVLKTGRQLKPSEFRLRDRQGRPVYVETFSSLIYRDGKPYAIQGIARDLTARKQAEEALRLSEKKFHQLFDAMTDAFASVNMAGQIQEFNPAYRQLLGYSDPELKRLSYQDLTPEKWRAFEAGIIRRQVLLRGYSEVYEKEYRRKDGVIIPVELRTLLIRDEQGKPSMMWAIVRDITARKQAEASLKQSNSLLSATLESTEDGILVVNTAGKVVAHNRRFLKLWRIPDKLMAAGDDARLLRFACDQLQQPEVFLSGVQKLYRRPGADSKDELLFKDGRVFERYSRPQRVGETIVGRVWSFRDISARKRAEAKLASVDRALKTTCACNRALVRAANERDLLRDICRAIIKVGGYRMVWIGFPAADNNGCLRVAASAGYEKGYLQQAKINWSDDNERGRGPSGVAFRTGKIVVSNDFQNDPITRPWWEEAARRGYGSCISLPLKHAGECFGMMMIYAARKDVFIGEEKTLLAELADDLSFGIHAMRVRQKNLLAEGSLRSSEDRFRKLFYDHAAVKLVTDLHTGKIVDANRAAAEFYGWPVAQLRRMNIGQINTVGVAALMTVIKKEKLAGRYQFEFQHRLADGSLRDVAVFCNPIEIAGRNLLYSIVQDITERKRALAALEQSETRFRQIVAGIEDVLYGVDSGSAEFSYVNPVFERMLGYTLEDVARMGGREKFLAEVIQDGKFEEQRSMFCQLQATSINAAPRWQSWWRCKDGSLKFIEDFWQPFFFQGKLQSTYGVLRDITGRKRVEAALRASEEQFRAIFDLASVGMAQSHPRTGQWLQVNQKMCDITGYPAAELLRLKVSDVTHPEDRRQDLELFQQVVRGERPDYRIEKRYLRKDGAVAWVNVNMTVIRDSSGQPLRTVATIEDISMRKQAEDEIRRLANELKLILETVPTGIAFLKGRQVVSANLTFDRIFGYAHGETVKLTTVAFYADPQDFERVGRKGYAAMARGETFRIELPMRRQDGSVFPCCLTGRAINPQNPAAGSIWQLEDITDRKRIELALAESEKKFRKLVQHMPVGLVEHGPDTRVLYCNAMAAQLLGLTLEQMQGRTAMDPAWKFIHEDGRDMAVEDYPVNQALRAADRIITGVIVGICRPDRKHPLWVQCHAHINHDPEGQIQRVIVTFADITERLQAEESLRRRQQILQAVGLAAEQLLRVPDWRDTIMKVLASLGEATGVSRVVIWQAHDGMRGVRLISQLYEWFSGGLASRVEDPTLKNLPLVASGFARWGKVLGCGEVIQGLVRDLPASEQPALKFHKILSIAVVPVMVDRQWWGFMAFDECRVEREWEADEIEALQAAARIFGEAIQREQVEKSLFESEWRFREMLQNISAVAVQSYGYDGTTHYWNHASGKLYGYTAEEAIGRNLLDLIIPPEMRPGVRQAISHMAETGQVIPASELTLMRKDGSPVTVFSSHAIVRVPGRPPELFCIDIDLTERKQAEAGLAANEKRYRAILDGSPVPLAVNDEHCNITYLNRAFLSVFGYTQEDIPTLSDWWLNAYPDPQYRKIITDAWSARLEKAQRTGDPFEPLEADVRCKDGTLRTILVGAASLSVGNYQGEHLAVLYDITDRKRAEESYLRLATAVEQSAETIVITDTDGKILYANPAFERSTGYTRVEVIGQNPRLFKGGKQDGAFYRKMWDNLTRGEVWAGHFVNKRKDGTLYEEEATISPIRDASGKIINYVAVKRDVTHEVELEGQLRQSQKMEAIGTLAGGIAHDFNNILNIIFGYSNLLQLDLAGKPEELEKLGEILKAGERAKNLVQQILTFSRQRAQARQTIQLNNVIKEAVILLRASLPANLQIVTELAADAPAVLADATQIYQVIMNLGTNALHAMEQQASGRLTINLDAFAPDAAFIGMHPELRAIKYARLTMADNGCGMDEKTLARIYDPFFTTKPVGKGTGLGMAVVHGIVESHDGVIMVESQPGQGTTFRLYFPEQIQDLFQDGIPEDLIPCGQGQRILIVDDEVALVGMYQRLLKALKYEGTVVTAPETAVGLVRENPSQFDLVITDLTMPGMNGLEVARQIREIREDMPVLLATGFHGTVSDRQLQDSGICEVVEKPISMAKLAMMLRGILGKK
ncbi:MAG: PAS domain S-box protein [Verrucomicrobiota bacterium]